MADISLEKAIDTVRDEYLKWANAAITDYKEGAQVAQSDAFRKEFNTKADLLMTSKYHLSRLTEEVKERLKKKFT